MRRTIFMAVALVAIAVPALAESEMPHDHPASDPALAPAPAPAGDAAPGPSPEAHHAVIQVNGLVCSFCAHGVEKSLSRLEGLDRDQFGNGVLVEIEAQRVTLALEPGAPIDLSEIRERILQGGYDPVRFHLRVRGRATGHGDHWVVHASEPKASFALETSSLSEDANVELRIHVEAAALESAEPGQPLPAVLDEIL